MNTIYRKHMFALTLCFSNVIGIFHYKMEKLDHNLASSVDDEQ